MNYCLHILSYTAQCKLPKVTGPCRDDLQVMWYYDTDMNRCRQFWYGCQGNANRFKSEKECLTTCQRIVTKGIAYCATCCAIYVCNTSLLYSMLCSIYFYTLLFYLEYCNPLLVVLYQCIKCYIYMPLFLQTFFQPFFSFKISWEFYISFSSIN